MVTQQQQLLGAAPPLGKDLTQQFGHRVYVRQASLQAPQQQ